MVEDSKNDAASVGAAKALLQPVLQARKHAKQKKSGGFRAGFANALAGGAGSDGARDGDSAGSSDSATAAATAGLPVPGSVPGAVPGSVPGSVPAFGRNPAWADGLGEGKYEWLVDCYRMRVDDDYAWGGNVRGLYASEPITPDFLAFCKLAVAHRVVPAGWDWRSLLAAATGLLKFAFEKSDAKEKYGGENIFFAAAGGRSLRATGEAVYGPMIGRDAEDGAASDVIEHCERWLEDLETICADVGGEAIWRELARALGEEHVAGAGSEGASEEEEAVDEDDE